MYLGNGSKDFHEFFYVRGFDNDKSFSLFHFIRFTFRKFTKKKRTKLVPIGTIQSSVYTNNTENVNLSLFLTLPVSLFLT